MIVEWMPIIDSWWLFLPLFGFVWAPKTWTPGELVSAAAMNTNIRDHLNESLRTQATTLVGSQNNLALDGPFAYLKCNNASALTMTGALIDSGNVDGGKVIVESLINAVTIKHQDAASTTSNRIITPDGGDLLLATFDRALLVYDGTASRWRVTRLGFSGGIVEFIQAAIVDIITGATTDSGFHMGEAADEGGWFTSEADTELSIAAASERVSGAWIARATESAMIRLLTSGVRFYYDSGLTDGNSFTPTERMAMTATALNIKSLFVQMDEISDPSAPAANKCLLYIRDNGGKTELVARFNTGAIQQVAIEP